MQKLTFITDLQRKIGVFTDLTQKNGAKKQVFLVKKLDFLPFSYTQPFSIHFEPYLIQKHLFGPFGEVSFSRLKLANFPQSSFWQNNFLLRGQGGGGVPPLRTDSAKIFDQSTLREHFTSMWEQQSYIAVHLHI